MQYTSNSYLYENAEKVAVTDPAYKDVLGMRLVDAFPEDIAQHLLSQRKASVFFINAHCANTRAKNMQYRAALARADFLLPDGIGVELAAKMRGHQLTANLNGTDFVPLLLRRAATQGLSVFLLGGAPGVAKGAAVKLAHSIPGLRIAGTRDGFDQALNEAACVSAINESGADIVLVAMGVPKQELWIDRNGKQLDAKLVIGVGALFDFLAGNVSRAPAAIRRAKLEWVWRLAMEPRRLAKRYVLGNFSFMARAGADALRQLDGVEAGKRAMDIMISGTALAVLGLPMLAIGAAIRLDSKGQSLFRQTRIGRNGKPFTMVKFRSMHTDAEARRGALIDTSDRVGICFKSRNDPRVTRVGRFLRRTSLDELPQLVNVFKGEMSIVGPRPALPEEVAAYPERAFARLQKRPGITGVWQVSGRANIGFDKMVDMDLAYVQSRSLLLDVLLIALTFRAVFTGRGAF